eukprot:jgi/Undpi1/13594/HiC_scaffold_9.g03248.m1
MNSVDSNTIIAASVNDAMALFVKSAPFLRALSSLVKEKTFEDAVSNANFKLPVNKADMKRVMADNSAAVHKMLSTSLQPAIAKALKGMDAATSSMAAASVELKSCSNAPRGESPVEVKRGGRKPRPNKGGKPASSSDELGDKDASLSGMEHDQLIVLVKGTMFNSLTGNVDPRFEQLTASITSSMQSVAQQSLHIARQMVATDVSSLRQELSMATTSVKALVAQVSEVSEDVAEIRSVLLANGKNNRPSTQEWESQPRLFVLYKVQRKQGQASSSPPAVADIAWLDVFGLLSGPTDASARGQET